MRRIAAWAGAITVATLLAGCDYFPPDRAGYQRDGDALVVAVCEAIDSRLILMETRGPDTNGDWEAFYEQSGSVGVSVGDTFSTSAAEQDLEGTTLRTSPSLVPGTEISVLFASNQTSFSSYVTVPADGVPSDAWLQPDGTTSEWPCGYKRSSDPE